MPKAQLKASCYVVYVFVSDQDLYFLLFAFRFTVFTRVFPNICIYLLHDSHPIGRLTINMWSRITVEFYGNILLIIYLLSIHLLGLISLFCLRADRNAWWVHMLLVLQLICVLFF